MQTPATAPGSCGWWQQQQCCWRLRPLPPLPHCVRWCELPSLLSALLLPALPQPPLCRCLAAARRPTAALLLLTWTCS
jgi:hypothetical protein